MTIVDQIDKTRAMKKLVSLQKYTTNSIGNKKNDKFNKSKKTSKKENDNSSIMCYEYSKFEHNKSKCLEYIKKMGKKKGGKMDKKCKRA